MQTQTHIQTNNIQLHVTQAGPEDGQLVILLHGFPEFWWGWRNQIDALAEVGHRDLRRELLQEALARVLAQPLPHGGILGQPSASRAPSLPRDSPLVDVFSILAHS